MRGSLGTQSNNDILLECWKQFEDHCSSGNFQFDIKLQQTVQGPIQLSTIENKGRCWIAKEKIKCGQLILIEKAFVYSSRFQHTFHNLYNNTNKEQDELIFDETAILMTQLIKHKIVKNPNKSISNLKYLYPRSNDIHDMDIFKPTEFGIEDEHDLWLYNHAMDQISKSKDTDKDNNKGNMNDILLKRIPYIVYYNVINKINNIFCLF